jgi:hypothetical protein
MQRAIYMMRVELVLRYITLISSQASHEAAGSVSVLGAASYAVRTMASEGAV